MKKIYSILMILAAAAGFTNCSKAELVENKETEKCGTVVYASTDVATKTTLADDYKVLWSTGDQIKFVKDDATTTTYTFTLSSGEGTTNGTFTYSQTPEDGIYTVYYPATYDGTSWHDQTYAGATDISGAPMKATATVSGGSVSDISFKNEGGILRYTVKGSKTIKSINVKSGSSLDITLSCGTSGVALTAEGTVFNIALRAGEYSNATLTFTATDNTVATKTASTFTVTKNKVSLATFEATALSFLTDGALPGLFTVGKGADGTAGTADDVQVRFSKGNLYASRTSSTSNDWSWGFYDKQYQFHSSSMPEISTSGGSRTAAEGDTEIDLFTWGYDNTSTKGSYSLNPVNTSGITGHNSDGNQFDTNEDWGSISGLPSAPYSGGWRTLTKDEWVYLLNTRTSSTVNGTANARYLKCKVNDGTRDVYGLLIFPDTFTWPTTVTAPGASDINKKNLAWNLVPGYNQTQFEALEGAGAVFLPAAGYRSSGSSVSSVGGSGRYWSSTAYDSGNAYYLNFDKLNFSPDGPFYRSLGFSVRLITESN